MAYTKEQLAEFATQALELRQRAHKLELEQAMLNENTSDYGDRHRSLRMRAKLLRAEAARVYAPVRLRWKKISRIMPKFDLARFWPSHF